MYFYKLYSFTTRCRILLFICIIALLTIAPSIAKPTLLSTIERALLKNDVHILNQYADSLEKSDKRINCYWRYFREVIPGFNEGILYIIKLTPRKGERHIVNELAYRVSIVTFDSAIAYYKLDEVVTNYEGNGEKTIKHKRTFKNDTAFVLLCNSFKSMFKKPLNMNELFIEDFKYGWQCGIVGVNPKPRVIMEGFVQNNNKDSLVQWLQSTSTEKQIYALEGLYELNKAGLQLTTKEKQMAMYVKAKKGTINYCIGCLHSDIKIFEVMKIILE